MRASPSPRISTIERSPTFLCHPSSTNGRHMMSMHSPIHKTGPRSSNERKCHVCARTFTKTEHLERHIRSHTKEKPYACSQCGRKYGRHDSLLRHIKDHHKQGQGDGQIPPPEDEPQPTPQMLDQPSHHQLGPQTEPAATSMTLPGIGDLNQVLEVPYSTGSTHQHVHFQSPPSAAPEWGEPSMHLTTNILGQDPATTFVTEDWFTYGNLDDSLLRGWPFVMDGADLGCTSVEPTQSHKPVADLRQIWHTHLEKDESFPSGYTTPLPNGDQDVDDSYRLSLHRRLQIRVSETTLPSAAYLNLCVRAYFKCFHPVFPIIHAATFRPTKINAVLLLSICSIGSLLTGHPAAVPRGIQLFERLNKATLSNWETVMRRGPEHTFAMTQASLLGQTFGLLSGRPNHLTIVETFHGTIVAWARRDKTFQHQDLFLVHQNLEDNWREWAQREERNRLAMAVHIHDAEIASTLHTDPFLSGSSRRPPPSNDDTLFFASTAQEWSDLYNKRQQTIATPASEMSSQSLNADVLYERLVSIPTDGHFAICSALEDILSATLQARADSALTGNHVNRAHTGLIAFYKQYNPSTKSIPPGSLQHGNNVLWHFIWINIHADMDLLEKLVGRDGPDLSPSDLARIQEWARSPHARRAAAHAMTIKRNLENFPLTSEPAIHVPRALFYSAICLFCYCRYADSVDSHSRGELDEFQMLNINSVALLRAAGGSGSTSNDSLGAVYGFVDLLRRIGHWEISRKFASILEALIHAEAG